MTLTLLMGGATAEVRTAIPDFSLLFDYSVAFTGVIRQSHSL